MADIELIHIREGAGEPPLVFVHGYLCEHENWRHQIDHFRKINTVVACDLRGMGRSPRGNGEMIMEQLGADVAGLLGAETLTGAVLVGHSMGCRVVMEAFLQARDRVAGLVLVDGSRGGQDRPADWARYDGAVAERGYRAVVRDLFEGMFFGDPPDWKDAALEKVYAVPETTGRPLYKGLIGWDADKLESALTEIDVPVLVLQSTYLNLDRQRVMLKAGETTPYQDLLAERLPKVRSVTLPAGHFSMIEQPAAVNAEIERFVADMVRPGGGAR